MSAIPRLVEVESERGLRCRTRIGYGGQSWRGVTRIATLEALRIEVYGQPALTFGEGDSVTLQIDSTVLGQLTTVVTVESLTIYNRTGNTASARIEVVPTLLDAVSVVAFRSRLAELKPLILSVGVCERLRKEDFPACRLDGAITLSDAARMLEEDEVAVVVFGPSVNPLELRSFFQSRGGAGPARSAHIVLYENTTPSAFQDLVNDDSIFYLTHASIPDYELRSTIAAAMRAYTRHVAKAAPLQAAFSGEENTRLNQLCLSLTRKSDMRGLALALSEEVSEILHATYSRSLFYDPRTDTLWEAGKEPDPDPISAAAGLVGYVARTGERVTIQFVAEDSRYDPEADNPNGAAETHFIAQPLKGERGDTIGVLAATRAAPLGPFTAGDEARIDALAERIAPLLHVLLSDLRTPVSGDQEQGADSNLFRKEALEYQDRADSDGKLLRGLPVWLAWSHLLIVLFLGISIAYVLLAKVDQVVTGPAVIRVTNKITVPALSSGVVEDLLVATGDKVTSGELMATLQSVPGDSLLTRMRKEVRAPADGTVSDIGIRKGQGVMVGEAMVSLGGEGSSNEVLALLPGSFAPQVHAGMPLLLKIEGYPQSREELTILDVAPDIVGPSDAERFVGKEIAQTLSLSGPILIVRSSLQRDTFEAAEESYRYHDGMLAQAEVSVHKEPLIIALLPGIKRFYDDRRISLNRTWGATARAGGRP